MRGPIFTCLMLLLSLTWFYAPGQTGNKTVFERNSDSLYTFYFDSQYYLTDKNCELYEIKRVSRYNASLKTFEGPFHDYDSLGNIVLTGAYKNGKKEGTFKSFYPGGFLKWQAEFENGEPVKTWYFYYPDGRPMSILRIENGEIYVTNTWNLKGKPAIKNGSGKYEVRDPQFGYNEEGYEAIICTGKVENGRPDGTWQLLYEYSKGERELMAVEKFEKGAFISGTSFINGASGAYTQSRLIFASSEPYLNAERFISKDCSIDEYYNFTSFLADHLSRHFNPLLLKDTVAKTIEVKLLVNKFGEASRFSITRGLQEPVAEKSLLQILNMIDYWIPSQKQGKIIEDTLTITFNVSSDSRGKILFTNVKISRASGS